MRIIQALQAPVQRSLSVLSGAVQFKPKLARTSQSCHTGTPLVAGVEGWRVAQPGERPDAFSAEYKSAGETVLAYREMAVETHKMQFTPGEPLAIADIDDYGRLTFKEDPDGPHRAISETQVLLTR